ncbi:MAG: metal-dependent hydrolase [Chitinophagaceae bacterium]
MIRFTYYGHACFALHSESKTLLFDPFISANELAKEVDIDSLSADYILLSHGHADHILDAERIAKRTGAKVIAAAEIVDWINKKGIQNAHPMNTGGTWDFGDFKLKCVVAQHSSGLPDGSYGGNPMGFIIFIENKALYYAGDTALTLDMKLIPTWAQLDAAIMPIGDNFTMGIDDALLACEFCNTQKMIAVHFDTFGYIKINHEEALQKSASKNIKLVLPKLLESFDLDSI